ncbi:hypothetical protein FJZ28_00040 [Candidatus Peregrinibacteria bacterium]|nr:hypothetical protein [Candidatus Peregrinibacteria bacterium]
MYGIRFIGRAAATIGACIAGIPVAIAQYTPITFPVSGFYQGDITWAEILSNIVGTMTGSVFYISAAAFLFGAMRYITGYINEEYKNSGKNIMIAALIGIVVALSALAILNTVLFYLYG